VSSSGSSNRWFRIFFDGLWRWIPVASVASPQPTAPYGSDLLPSEVLYQGDSSYSGNGLYHLVMRGDGNLVLYQGSRPLWGARTSPAGSHAIMQPDGNVVYSAATMEPRDHSEILGLVWSSKTIPTSFYIPTADLPWVS
jgi:hypothetical protein